MAVFSEKKDSTWLHPQESRPVAGYWPHGEFNWLKDWVRGSNPGQLGTLGRHLKWYGITGILDHIFPFRRAETKVIPFVCGQKASDRSQTMQLGPI